MMELLNNARTGWLDYMAGGKVAALFLIALFLTAVLKLAKEKQEILWKYCVIMSAVCIFPVTAVALMLYQTKFYDYQWIWTLIPVTAMTACGMVLIAGWLRRKTEGNKVTGALIAVVILAMLILCAADPAKNSVKDLTAERQRTSAVLQYLTADGGTPICLWAPEEIMGNVRSLPYDVKPVYGRNMWQEHLNAYTYDTYTYEQRELYVWMEMAGRYGWLDVPVEAGLKVVGEAPKAGSTLEGERCLRNALQMGVNCMILPANAPEKLQVQVADILGVKAEVVEGYYVFRRMDE